MAQRVAHTAFMAHAREVLPTSTLIWYPPLQHGLVSTVESPPLSAMTTAEARSALAGLPPLAIHRAAHPDCGILAIIPTILGGRVGDLVLIPPYENSANDKRSVQGEIVTATH